MAQPHQENKSGNIQKEKDAEKSNSEQTMSKGLLNNMDLKLKQSKYFQELHRLETSLHQDRSNIKPPARIKFKPYIFSSLKPYFDTTMVQNLMKDPYHKHNGYSCRLTAVGLCDPWENLKLDINTTPRISSKAINQSMELKKIRKSKKQQQEGSTRLPKFPMITLETQDLINRQLTFSDVPRLRKELHEKYTMNAKRKIDDDYIRTKQDFYRMDLHKMDEIHPKSRPHVRASYFAYLQNTPGSRKAVYECVKKLEV